jgi:CcmD family protein
MNLYYLFGAYLLIWVGTLLYLFSIDHRQKEVKSALEQALKKD